MSQQRKDLFALQKERIELAADLAFADFAPGTFMIAVLAIKEPFAREIACEILGNDAVVRQEAEHKNNASSQVLIAPLSMHDANVVFEHQEGWHRLNRLVYPDRIFPLAIVADGGISFVTHTVPA